MGMISGFCGLIGVLKFGKWYQSARVDAFFQRNKIGVWKGLV